MTDKDFNYPPLDERKLGLLFNAAQQEAPEMGAELLTRLQSQAFEAMPQEPKMAFAPEKLSLFERISDVLLSSAAGPQWHAWPRLVSSVL